MLSPDDLRYFLAVAKTGRLVSAARELAVDHTTIGRRITALEKSLGQRLFDRGSKGWELTESGALLLEPAESVEAALIAAQDVIGSRGAELRGRVRVSSVDGFGAWCLAPALGKLRTAHPHLTIEVAANTAHLPLTVRDFDVAITMEEPSVTARVTKRWLTDYVMRMYATQEYLDRSPPVEVLEDLAEHTLIWWTDHRIDLETLAKVRETLGDNIQIQSTTVSFILEAAAGGAGIAVLPQFIAAHRPSLVHVLPEIEFRGNYWLVIPRELARLARIGAVVQVIDEIVDERRDEIAGAPR
ncbi:LysR family transcriptional regulator [Antrihabitans cavernicola]|uniref:LysR family transcriptional regulator n=1 Tax=Antrihabitans cavernicola TaxID=2495913 RepID=UPI00165900FC|nr:LysR family transcriptional regulator [Spelaeibacter cavernicola]